MTAKYGIVEFAKTEGQLSIITIQNDAITVLKAK